MARRLRFTAALFAVAALVAACGSDDKATTSSGSSASSGGAKTTYALAFVGPLTGPNANLGINPRDGALVAIKEANDAGGDITFELKQFDTQGDPAQAPTVKDKYINDDSVLGVVGPVFSGETKAVLQSFEDAGLVMVSPSATGVTLSTVVPNSKSFHRIVPDDDVQATGVTAYITKKLKSSKVFYIHDNQEYGKGLAEGTQKSLEAAGVATVGTDAIDPNAQDYSAAVNKAKAAKPDLVYYGGYYSQAGRLAKQLKDAGLDALFLSGDGVLDPGFIQSGGAGAEGAQMTCACKLATSDAAGALGTFAKAYKEQIGKDPGTYSTEGYDATKLLIEGIKKGNTTRQKLRDYVNNVGTYAGAGKDISFEANGNIKAGGVFVYEVKSAKLAVLGSTDELAK
jgi:branched-chain amino acid transport system substrate-binding protein